MAKFNNLRQQILDEARHLLVGEGYGGMSMRKIAHRAGCTPTSIYIYFQNKDQLIHTLIEEGMDNLHQDMMICQSVEQEPLRQFENLCRIFLEFGFANPEYYLIMFQMPTEPMSPYPIEKYRKARRNLKEFATLIFELRGDCSEEDALLAATSVWALLHGSTSLFLTQRIDTSIDRENFISLTINSAVSMLDIVSKP